MFSLFLRRKEGRKEEVNNIIFFKEKIQLTKKIKSHSFSIVTISASNPLAEESWTNLFLYQTNLLLTCVLLKTKFGRMQQVGYPKNTVFRLSKTSQLTVKINKNSIESFEQKQILQPI